MRMSMPFALLRFLLVLVFIGFPAISFSHEERSNPAQRRAIQERLKQRSCEANTRGVRPRSGGTRGASISLPAIAQQYSDYFSQVIEAEFDLPYGKETDPNSYLFFLKDSSEGRQKIATQMNLGIRWPSDTVGPPSSIPSWIELAQAYRNDVISQGISLSKTFVPVLVLYRESKTAAGVREYYPVDPISGSFPEDIATWEVLTKDLGFNLPFAVMFQAMKEGKFPLLDAAHDISHFISFSRFPAFASGVLRQMQKVNLEELTLGFKAREYWLTEALSIPNPLSQSSNHEYLQWNHRPKTVRTVEVIESELTAMETGPLVEYCLDQANYFLSQLQDVSGGNSNSAEKWFYLGEVFGLAPMDLVEEKIPQLNQVLARLLELSATYFENGPVTLKANKKELTNETATFSFNTFMTAQKLLALVLKQDGVLAANPHALKDLIRFASRTEYLLTLKPFSYDEWTEEFLQADLPKDRPISQMLMTVFGNELISKFYLGRGQRRNPSK